MMSLTGIVLATVLPLSSLAMFLMLLLIFFLRRYSEHRMAKTNLEDANNEIGKLKKKLDSFPKAWAWNFGLEDHGFDTAEVTNSYGDFLIALDKYVKKWIVEDEFRSPPRADSVARIESLLFPVPRLTCPYDAAKDASLFSNPHQYTPAEITNFFENNNSRIPIAGHIMAAVILRGVSFEGSCDTSLLSFASKDIQAIITLHDLIRGLDRMIQQFFSLLSTSHSFLELC